MWCFVLMCHSLSVWNCALWDVISLNHCINESQHVTSDLFVIILCLSLWLCLTNKRCIKNLLLHVHEWLHNHKVTEFCIAPLFTQIKLHTHQVWIMLKCLIRSKEYSRETKSSVICSAHTNTAYLTTYTFLFLDCALDSGQTFPLNCIDDAAEEDEISSLWSTTSSFICLFISSLLYSMIFSLVKVNKQAFSTYPLCKTTTIRTQDLYFHWLEVEPTILKMNKYILIMSATKIPYRKATF